MSAKSERITVDSRRNWNRSDDAAEIIQDLWISNRKTARNKKFILKKGIRFIIDASATVPKPDILKFYRDNGIRYVSLGPDFYDRSFETDDEKTGITREAFLRYVNRANELILEAFKKSADNPYPILVHCYAGVNRSASSIAAFLIKSRYLSHAAAVQTILDENRKQRRAPALTNHDFVDALKSLVPVDNSTISETVTTKDMIQLSLSCSLPYACLHCGKEDPVSKCCACVDNLSPYCDKDCQREHWIYHKPFCMSNSKKI